MQFRYLEHSILIKPEAGDTLRQVSDTAIMEADHSDLPVYFIFSNVEFVVLGCEEVEDLLQCYINNRAARDFVSPEAQMSFDREFDVNVKPENTVGISLADLKG